MISGNHMEMIENPVKMGCRSAAVTLALLNKNAISSNNGVVTIREKQGGV